MDNMTVDWHWLSKTFTLFFMAGLFLGIIIGRWVERFMQKRLVRKMFKQRLEKAKDKDFEGFKDKMNHGC